MKIALISYEYPGDTGGGGIGTYVQQASRMLAQRGHKVEVFCGTNNSSYAFEDESNVYIHRIQCKERTKFHQDVLEKFKERQREVSFNIVEGPEYMGDSWGIRNEFPEIPHVIKLHTPSYKVNSLNTSPPNFWAKLRFIIGALRRGKLYKPFWHYNQNNDIEYAVTNSVKTILHPSRSIRDIVQKDWNLLKHEFKLLPYPFIPPQELLILPPSTRKKSINILFLGRLEKRKGIFSLLEAIPLICQKYDNVKFILVGKSMPHPKLGIEMNIYIKNRLNAYLEQVEVRESVSYSEIPKLLNTVDICIFPSLWENFPNVCLEAMAAGKAIIGSQSGGMADMLEDAESGFLIDPQDIQSMAQRIGQLIENPELRIQMGKKAREKVLQAYSAKTIGQMTESIYQQIIEEWN